MRFPIYNFLVTSTKLFEIWECFWGSLSVLNTGQVLLGKFHFCQRSSWDVLLLAGASVSHGHTLSFINESQLAILHTTLLLDHLFTHVKLADYFNSDQRLQLRKKSLY